ncbi:MAG: CHAT domain-containing protein [Acidobacteriota bacterium]
MTVAAVVVAAALALGSCGPRQGAEGLEVHSVEAWGSAAEAGLLPGDVLLAWSRGEDRGTFDSPLDLRLLEQEQAPRGPVRLEVRRGGARLGLRIGADLWRLEVRPSSGGGGAGPRAEHRAALDHEAGGRPADAARAWGRLAATYEHPDLVAWARGREGRAWIRAGEVESGQGAFASARSALGSPALQALLWHREAVELTRRGRYGDAKSAVDQAISLRRDVDPQSPALAASLIRAAECEKWLGRTDIAFELSRDTLNIAEPLPLGRGLEARAYGAMASSAYVDGDYDTAATHFLHALDQQRGRPGPFSAWLAYSLGQIRRVQGNLDGAERLYRQAEGDLRSTRADDSLMPRILLELGHLYERSGDVERSQAVLERALLDLPQPSLDATRARISLAVASHHRGQRQAADRLTEEVLGEIAELDPNPLAAMHLDSAVGSLLTIRDRPREALPFLERAVEARRRTTAGGLPVAASLQPLAWALFDLGELDRAEAVLTEALEILDSAEPRGVTAMSALNVLGEVHRARGDAEAAERRWRRGLDILEVLRSGIRDPEARARFTQDYYDYYPGLAELLVERGRADEALVLLDGSRGRAARGDVLRRAPGRPAHGQESSDREGRRLDREIARLLARLGRLPAATSAAEIGKLRGDIRRLKLEREVRGETLRHATAPRPFQDDPEPLTLEELRAQLDPDSAFLLYSVRRRSFLLFVLTHRTLDAFALDVDRDTLERRVDVLRSLIARGNRAADGEPEPYGPALMEQAARLYDLVLRPADTALKGVRHLRISAEGPLASLPFAALVGDRKSGEFLAQRHILTRIPSLGVLEHHRTDGVQPQAGSFVAFGDPTYPPEHDLVQGLGLRPLPGSGREVARIAELFPEAEVFVGDRATEGAARRWLGRARYLHVAAHALLDRRFPRDSSLAFAQGQGPGPSAHDGLLHAWEIAEHGPVSAEIVTLSACETGVGTEQKGEGLQGLAQTFHWLGARSVVASLWRVDDDGAAELMVRFYARVRDGHPPGEALALARRELITNGSTRLAHPHVWAAFTLSGEG